MSDLHSTICERRTYSGKANTHDHHFGQLLFPLQGAMSIQTTRQSLRLDGDSLFYLPPQCTHTFHGLNRNECLVLDIPTHFLPQTGQFYDGRGVHINLDERWKSVRCLLLEETYSNHTRSSGLTHLVQYVIAALHEPRPRSIQYIHEHYNKKLTIRQLAEIEHYHPAYYQDWFKKRTGQNPTTYIHRLQLSEAKRLLTETNWPISTIARQVGYDYPASFTRMFVRYEGETPQMYREKHSQNDSR